MNWGSIWTGLATVGGVLSATVATFTYRGNSRTRAAEFLVSLHKTFFIEPTYQPMKELLDCDGPEEDRKLGAVVQTESAQFTDFLNFFEIVAYLSEIGTLSPEDVNALLGYYLDKLRAKTHVWENIRWRSKSFEHLARLLAERQIHYS